MGIWSVDKRANGSYIALCIFTSACVLSLFAGSREIGFDYDNYVYHFQRVPFIYEYTWTDKSMEIGYEMIVSLCKTICNSFHFFLIAFSLITIVLAFVLLKRYSPYVLLSFFMFFAISFYPQVMGQMRQPLAIILTLLALIPLLERKRIKLAILWIIFVGFFFHKAILLLTVPIFILTWDFHKKKIILFSVMSLTIYLFSPALSKVIITVIPKGFYLSDVITAYLTYKSIAVNFTLGMLERIGICFILFYYAFKYNLYEKNQTLKLCINMYFIGTCMYFAFISMSAEFAARGTLALVYPLFIALPILLKHAEMRDKYIILTIICLWGIYLSMYITDNSEYIPYKSIIF